MKDKILHHSFFRFLLVGVGNTLLSLLLMFLLEDLGYWPSTAIAYVAGAILSFFLNRSFTFHSKEAFLKSVWKFALNVAICYVLGYGLARLLIRTPELTAVPLIWFDRLRKLVGMALYTLFNYFGQRFFVFFKREKRT